MFRIKQKREAVLDYWTLTNIKIEGKSVAKGDALTAAMSKYEDKYDVSLDKLNRYTHKLASQVTLALPRVTALVQLPKN